MKIINNVSLISTTDARLLYASSGRASLQPEPIVRPRTQQPEASTGPDLSVLSARHESKGDWGAIGYDSKGGWSYGRFQIATNSGTMALFLDYLKTEQPQAYALLQRAGGSAAAMQGRAEFKDTWRALAADKDLKAGFAQAQYGFIKTQHFDVLAAKVQKDTGLDVGQRSVALQNVVWSVAVQH
jgi:hypothetical protein